MNLKFKIGIVGLGYVGLPLAVEFGKKYQVIGYDSDQLRVSELRNCKDKTKEVSKNNIENSHFLSFSDDKKDLAICNIFIITVPSPITKANRPDLSFLKKASETVGRFLKKESIVIYESTVYPGCTEEVMVPILEKISGL